MKSSESHEGAAAWMGFCFGLILLSLTIMCLSEQTVMYKQGYTQGLIDQEKGVQEK